MSVLGANYKVKQGENTNEVDPNGSNLASEPIKLAQIRNNMHNSSISRIDEISIPTNTFKNEIPHPDDFEYNNALNYRCEYARFGEIYCNSEL